MIERKVVRRGVAQGWRRELGVTGVVAEQAIGRKGRREIGGNREGVRLNSSRRRAEVGLGVGRDEER